MSAATSHTRTPSAPSPTPARMWGKREIAALFGIGISTVDLWRRDGRLPKGLKVGKSVRWEEQVIRRHFGMDNTTGI